MVMVSSQPSFSWFFFNRFKTAPSTVKQMLGFPLSTVTRAGKSSCRILSQPLAL